MRLPRVRFTVRRMMVAVTASGLAIGAYAIMIDRAGRFRSLATYHDLRRARFDAGTTGHRVRYNAVGQEVDAGEDGWHLRLAEKYRRAARYLWLPVEPDPPEPE